MLSPFLFGEGDSTMANTPNSLKPKHEDNITDSARNFGSAVAEKARETASDVGQKASDAAANVGQKATDMAANVGHKAEDATSAVGHSMKSLAGTIRENAPHGGMIGSASSNVAQTLERGGRYLEEQGLKGIGTDLTDMVRRNPIPALLLGIGLGFLLARATRS
jgi:ABC-type transporter Mla subunit MlaD